MFKQYALESYFAQGIAFAYKQQSGNKRRYYAVDHSGKVTYDFGSLIPYEINGNKIVVKSKDRKIGLMNLDFSAVKYYDYQDIHEFSEGIFVAEKKDGIIDFLDAQGQVIVRTNHKVNTGIIEGKKIFNPKFKQGLLRFVKGDKIGYLNKKGDVVIPPRFKNARDFSDGLAYVVEADTSIINDEYTGYINKKGEWAFKPTLNSEVYWGDYSSGLIQKKDTKTELYGYVNSKNQWVINPIYKAVEPFENGLAEVTLPLTAKNKGYKNYVKGEKTPYKQLLNPKGKIMYEGHFKFSTLNDPDVIIISQDISFASQYVRTNNYIFLDRNFNKIYEPPCDKKIIPNIVSLKNCDPTQIKRISLAGIAYSVRIEDVRNILEKTNPVYLDMKTTQPIDKVPSFIYKMTNLEVLKLTFCGIKQISEAIGNLKNLKTLDLYFNKLKRLPEAVFHLPKLKKLELDENNFSEKYKTEIRKRLPEVRVSFY